VLLELVESGLSREEAYDLVQRCAMESWERGISFKDLLAAEELVAQRLNKEKLDDCFDPAYYLRRVDYIYKRLGII
jgi:adenylosuccinate lyase